MKKLATFSLLTAALLTLTPRPAEASDKGLAILGGFLGGVLVANAVNHSSHHETVVVSSAYCPPAPVVVIDNGCGYWQETPVRVWVAPAYTIVYDSCHRPIRRFTAGYYTTRINRVWISGSRRVVQSSDYDHRPRHERDYRRDSDRRDRRGRY